MAKRQRKSPKAPPPSTKPTDVAAPDRSPVFWGATLALCAATLAVGTLQTTLGFGRAIPGWPNSFTWPWIFLPPGMMFDGLDIFLAQTHRLLGYATLAATAWGAVHAWRHQETRAVRLLAIGATVGMPLLAISGGLRIAWDRTAWANVHACLALLPLALLTALVVLHAKAWRERPASGQGVGRFGRVGLLAIAALTALQLIAGAQLRHVTPHVTDIHNVLTWVWLHVAGAVLLACMLLLLPWTVRSGTGVVIRRLRLAFGVLLLLQIVLGLLNWVLQYNFPLWFMDYVYPANFTIAEGGTWQTTVATLHAVNGYAACCVGLALGLMATRQRGAT